MKKCTWLYYIQMDFVNTNCGHFTGGLGYQKFKYCPHCGGEILKPQLVDNWENCKNPTTYGEWLRRNK